MRGTDHGDDRDIGLAAGRHRRDLTKSRHAHLKDCGLGFFVHAQCGQRHTDGIIQVALGLERVVSLGQYRRDHLLGSRLAHRAGDRDNRAVKLRPVSAREVEQTLTGILDVKCGNRIGFVLAVGQNCGGASLDGLTNKVMSVEPLALDRNEQAPRACLARVTHNACDDRVGRACAARPGRSL